MNQDFISFDVGTNFDYKLFDAIDQYDTKHSITNLYGKLKNDGMPGGRAASIIPDFTMDEFEAYLKECKKRNLSFNYLINPLSLDQNEYDPVVGKKMRDFIHTLYDVGVREITLNSPILIKYVRKEFPDMFITLGLYAYPTTIQHVEYWRTWGINEITLDHSFNRKFDVLRSLLTEYKDSDFHMRVIANNLCLRECPYRLAHGSFVGHSDPTKTSMDYTLINCNYHKISQPAAFLTSEWIRPEDVHYYRALAEETGNKNFAIKLIDRTRTTEFITNVIRAYMTESYDGNLLDIVNYPTAKTIDAKKHIAAVDAGMNAGAPPQGMPAGGPPQGMPMGGPPAGRPALRFEESLKPEAMMQFGRTMGFPKIYVDNKKLDGFLEHFINDYKCDKSLCISSILEDDISKYPNACGHCKAWAKKVISYDVNEVEQWKAVASDLLSKIENGTIYKDAESQQ
ncbi:MAG: hypothetical protein IJJ69_05015 [Oscillospiraceae bacterium]|nr:hypothetical protein [Oscillospiraceae bacterium]